MVAKNRMFVSALLKNMLANISANAAEKSEKMYIYVYKLCLNACNNGFFVAKTTTGTKVKNALFVCYFSWLWYGDFAILKPRCNRFLLSVSFCAEK